MRPSEFKHETSHLVGNEKEAINLAMAHSLILQRSEPAQYGSKNLWILYYRITVVITFINQFSVKNTHNCKSSHLFEKNRLVAGFCQPANKNQKPLQEIKNYNLRLEEMLKERNPRSPQRLDTPAVAIQLSPSARSMIR